jgi:hypothetical protein
LESRLPSLDIIAPVIMSCALLWWVSRGMTWSMRLTIAAITLALIVVIVTIERSGFWAKADSMPGRFQSEQRL